ncbi:calmodulin-like 3, partial [Ceratobasidium sp. 392]
MPTVPSPPLNEEQLEELREAFRIFDKNGDGRITASELGTMLRAMDKRPSDAEVQSMLDKADTNHDGVLDFPEFAALMGARLTISQAEDELRKVFKDFDLDRDGMIERAEMKAVLEKLGDKLSDEEIQLIIREVDTDGDGKVNFT